MHDVFQMRGDRFRSHALDEQRKVVRTVGEQRQYGRVALVAGAAVREFMQKARARPRRRGHWRRPDAHHRAASGTTGPGARSVDSRTTLLRTASRGISVETIPMRSVMNLRAPPPPAGPLV